MEIDILNNLGYLGLFLGAFLAATIVPFSSDFLVIGALAANGSPIIIFFTATAGNWMGGLTSYWLGWLGKWEWLERWFGITREKLERHQDKIDKYRVFIALVTWLPFVGDLFAVALGFYKINFFKSAFFMLIGKAARFAFWIMLYKILGDNIF